LPTQIRTNMWHKKIPDYYLSKDNIIFFLILVFAYSLIFVNVFTPFQGAWYNILHYTRAQLFADTLIIVTGGSIVLLISRMLMARSHNKRPISQLQYWTWSIAEVFSIAILYTLIVHFLVHDERNLSQIFARAVFFVPTIIAIPTIISLLYFSSKAKDEKIEELEKNTAETAAPESPIPDAKKQPDVRNGEISEEDFSLSDDFSGADMVLDSHITRNAVMPAGDSILASAKTTATQQETPPPPPSRIVNFLDDKDELQLSLRIDHIYYIESAENYVHIYYRNKENIERFTLRSSMKKQQEKLEKQGFIRCHRSYLVNFSNILLLRKDKDGPYLDFGESGLQPIPISKTYLDAVTAYFIQNSED